MFKLICVVLIFTSVFNDGECRLISFCKMKCQSLQPDNLSAGKTIQPCFYVSSQQNELVTECVGNCLKRHRVAVTNAGECEYHRRNCVVKSPPTTSTSTTSTPTTAPTAAPATTKP